MMRKKRTINSGIYILFFIALVAGCSGTLTGSSKLDNMYENSIGNRDINMYYNIIDGYIEAAVQNMSSTFMTNLNMALECEYDSGDVITDIRSLSNLKTYFYKNTVFGIDYKKCKSLVLKYIYYPQQDGGFMFTDRFGSYPMPVENDIPVEGVLVIK